MKIESKMKNKRMVEMNAHKLGYIMSTVAVAKIQTLRCCRI